MTAMHLKNIAGRECERNIGEAVEHETNLCNEVETVRRYIYLSDRQSEGEGCEAVPSARKRCGWVRLRECSELLHRKNLHVKIKVAVHKSYIRPATLYESKAWSMEESKKKIL